MSGRKPPAVTPAGSPRRSSSEVRQAIFESARAVFASRGYSATRMRDIAERAGVYEPMIYRRVGSKAQLFEAAVLEPFENVVSAHVARTAAWEQTGPLTDITSSWVPPLYEVMEEHRELVLALMVAEVFHPDEFGDSRPLSRALKRIIDQTVPAAAVEVERRDLLDVDVESNIVVALGMVLGVVQLCGLLDLDDDYPGRERVLAEMVKLCVHGMYRTPASDEEAPVQLGRAELAELLDRVTDAERRASRAELELEVLAKQKARWDTRRR
jgi:AcrR family transcriptional regulator